MQDRQSLVNIGQNHEMFFEQLSALFANTYRVCSTGMRSYHKFSLSDYEASEIWECWKEQYDMRHGAFLLTSARLVCHRHSALLLFQRVVDNFYSNLAEEELVCSPNLLSDQLYNLPTTYCLKITLKLLQYYIWRSRRFYLQNSISVPSNDQSSVEQVTRLLLLQECSILQVLLNALRISVGGDSGSPSVRLICNFMQEMLLERPSLTTLIHQQTYPITIVPYVIEYVPALRITVDQVPELISNVHTREFGMTLAGCLALKYPTERIFELTRVHVLPYMNATMTPLTKIEIATRFIRAFPKIIEEFAPIIMEWNADANMQPHLVQLASEITLISELVNVPIYRKKPTCLV